MIPGVVAALRAVIPVRPQQPAPHGDAITRRFEAGVPVRLGASPFAGRHPAHIPARNAA